ncbi:unnamed protein product [Triticum turgidum subsp. durum]|uniref:Uncharacterized protein n=1 Tax=Triticum turgidum subsp. durum TaxID=4567 RepID=A0A9R0XWH2_TRITD|nr:unnamed protein product [Triticum turgidum subsp. durum]
MRLSTPYCASSTRTLAAAATVSSSTRASTQESRRHHLAFSVPDSDRFATKLKNPGTDLFAKTQPDGRARQVFFLDRDGNQIFNGGRWPQLFWLLLYLQ